METTGKLEELLNGWGGEGELESSSEFTIDTLRARQKLAESQLPQAGLWLVKLVQAAVAAEANEIRITFGSREVQFHATVPAFPWKPSQVLSRLLAGEIPQEPALLHLFTGLRGSVFQNAVEADWMMATEGTLFRVRFGSAGTEISETLRQEGDEVGCYLSLKTSRPRRWPAFRRSFSQPLKHLIRQTADEFMALHNYAWTCPCPLRIDGRLLEPRYRPAPALGAVTMREVSQQFMTSTPLVAMPSTLVRRELPAPEGRPRLHLDWPVDYGEFYEFDEDEEEEKSIVLKLQLRQEEIWCRWFLDQDQTVGGLLFLLFGSQLESRCEFVCDGAIVGSHPLPWSSGSLRLLGKAVTQNQFKVGLRVLLPVSADELDLSHFRVRRAETVFEPYEEMVRTMLLESVQFALEYKIQYIPGTRFTSEKVGLARRILDRAVADNTLTWALTQASIEKELEALLDSLEGEPSG